MRHDHDYVHPDARARAEAFIRTQAAETQRPHYGAQEQHYASTSGYTGAGDRSKLANRRHSAAREAKEDFIRQVRATGREPTEDELHPFDDTIAREGRSEVAANADLPKAGQDMTDDRNVANGLVKYLAQVAVSGAQFRRKVVRLGRGDPSNMLAVNLARQKELRTEGERVRNAGTPVAVLKEGLLAGLDTIVAERDPYRIEYYDGEAKWRHPVLSLPAVHLEPARVVTTHDLVPLLLTLAGDDLRKRLTARIDADHRGDTSLRITREEKTARLAKVRADLLEAQYEEGALRVLLAGDAAEIKFRPQMDPRTILGVEGPLPQLR